MTLPLNNKGTATTATTVAHGIASTIGRPITMLLISRYIGNPVSPVLPLLLAMIARNH